MAYIGQNADGNFTTTPVKDTFNGDGSTVAFTLSQGGATNTVDVFVENVRQEPTEAYSVNGTTLTFTEAPGTGTGNIYVVNRGPAQLTATHPSGQALQATNGTFTGDLTVDGAGARIYLNDANEDIDMNSTADGQLRLDGSGYAGAIALNTEGMNIYTNASSRDIIFGVNETERMRIINSGGITFNGDTAAANALNDYEEGTWTATTDQGTLNSSSTCKYVKVGNLVTVTGLVSGFSDRSSNSHVEVKGLPFSTGSTDIAIGATLPRYINAPGDFVSTYLGTSRDYLSFYSLNQGSAYDIVRHSDLNSSSSNFHFTITYRAA